MRIMIKLNYSLAFEAVKNDGETVYAMCSRLDVDPSKIYKARIANSMSTDFLCKFSASAGMTPSDFIRLAEVGEDGST